MPYPILAHMKDWNKMEIYQKKIALSPMSRGYHLITSKIEGAMPDIRKIRVGMLHVFIQHTSAGLTLNENADPTVRYDFEEYFNRTVPENAPYYEHNYEGDDDMPAHLKASIFGSSVTIPITNGRLNLGTWQGIYLCEFRNRGGSRSIVITAYGN